MTLHYFFKEIAKEIQERHEQKIIIGDFNLVLDVDLDRHNTYNNNKAMEEVKNIMEQYYLCDIWRIQHEKDKEYSWFKRGQGLNKASRIDFALVSLGLSQQVKHSIYLSSIYTDHRALYLVVEIINTDRGVGYWKLNTELLQEKEYVELINSEIRTTIATSTYKTPCQRWEHIKTRIKKSSIQYSKQRTSEQKLTIAQLTEKLNDYESKLPQQRG